MPRTSATLVRALALFCALGLAFASPPSHAQEPASPPPPPASADQGPPDQPPLSAGEIEGLVAPIALYPDDLLAQVLMASTYPLEIVQAARWVKEPANAKLKGTALDDALAKQEWDPSVKSLAPFPSVLANMNEKLDWTQKLGDAFLDQQKDVMDAVQRLRKKAQDAGNLKSNEQQTVKVETPPETQQQVIIIQPANPQVVYVPTYQPTVVYGTWGYPAYPPYYWPPPPGAAFAAGFFWGTAFAVSASYWGFGHCGWGHGDVDINVNNSTNIKNDFNRKNNNIGNNNKVGNNGKWQHDPSHRKGVNYGNAKTRDQYGRGQSRDAAARDNFRGRDSGGLGGGGSGTRAGGGGMADRGGSKGLGTGGAGTRDQGRGGATAGNKVGSSDRGGSAIGGNSRGGDAFDRSGGGGSARASSARGNSSFGGSHGGGGASRGGGGGHRGGGGGGRRR
jgi:Protein of unknown function (DUF3300)